MVDDSLRASERWPTSSRTITTTARLLLIAAAIQMAVPWLARSAITQPLPIGAIVSVVAGSTSFVLAAAALAGSSRWPQGRRWLILGGAAFALAGVLDLARDLWFAAQAYGNVPIDDPSQTLMRLRSVITAALTVAAPLLLGIGIWASRPHDLSRQHAAAIVALGVVGFVATLGGLISAWIASGILQATSTLFDGPLLVLTALGAAGFLALGVAAASAVHGKESLPELLIAAGATAWLCSAGWLQWSSVAWLSAVPQQPMPPGWAITVSFAHSVALLGTVTVIAGFGLAGPLRLPRTE